MSTVSVVTGANSGIGRAIAIHLAGRGHEVYGTVRDPARAGKLQSMAADAGVDVQLVTMDVADDESVRLGLAIVIDKAGRVDVLVNNAGVGSNAVVEEASSSEILEVTNVNVCGAVRCLQAVLPGMRARRSGAIVNVTSVAGVLGHGSSIAYAASKAALNAMTKSLARAFAPSIRVNAVAPGPVLTRWLADHMDQVQQQLTLTPMKRAATPDDVADVVAFLATGSSLITGQIVVLDGGRTM